MAQYQIHIHPGSLPDHQNCGEHFQSPKREYPSHENLRLLRPAIVTKIGYIATNVPQSERPQYQTHTQSQPLA